MSKTLPRYTGSVSLKHRRRVRRHTRVAPVLLVFLVAVAAYIAWTTRDSHPLHEFIPAGQRFGIVFTDAIGRRAALAESRVWRAMPDKMGFAAIPEVLGRDFGMPEWVVNNLVPEQSYVTGNDLKRFRDTLFLSKMTRVGRLLEDLARWGPWTQGDYAGGLKLREWIRDDLYYAVRGRALIVSPSRDAIIRALTLREEDAIGAEAFAARMAGPDAGDLWGSVALAPDDPFGKVFRSARLGLRIGVRDVYLKCRATLTPVWQARLSPLLEGASPQPLATPLEGMLAISANFGKSLEGVHHGVSMALPWPAPPENQRREPEQVLKATAPELAQMLTTLLGPSGPGFRLSWQGVDLNEIIPVPEIVGVFQTSDVDIAAMFEAFPPLPQDVHPWEPVPRYDPETKLVSLPLLSGPSFEPTFASYGGELLASNSRTVVEAFRARSATRNDTLPQPGNLFVKLYPLPCVQTVVEVGHMLAEVDMLGGFTRDSFEETAAAWLDQAGRIEEFSLLASWDGAAIVAEVTLRCRDSQ